jgi:hypothetical protein
MLGFDLAIYWGGAMLVIAAVTAGSGYFSGF